jgi:hypothetical protein
MEHILDNQTYLYIPDIYNTNENKLKHSNKYRISLMQIEMNTCTIVKLLHQSLKDLSQHLWKTTLNIYLLGFVTQTLKT